MTAFSNKVVDFGGTDEYVTMGDVLNFERTDSFSISCWFKTTGTNSAHLVTKRNASPIYQGRQFYISASGALYFSLINDWSIGNRLQVYTTTAWNNGAWHHVVATYDGSSTAAGVKIYVDNVLQTLIIEFD